MALITPKIVWPSGGVTTLTFAYPPRFVPYRTYKTTRTDNIASSGVKETIFQRTDKFLVFTMEYVKIGADIAAWDAFVTSALQGIPFDYYPDSTLGSLTTYTLFDTTWDPAYKSVGAHTFQMKLYQRIAWP